MKIKSTLRLTREKIGLTQIEIAEKANISIRNYQYYEAGERVPNVHTAQLIAKVLGIENVKDIFPLPQENDNTKKNN